MGWRKVPMDTSERALESGASEALLSISFKLTSIELFSGSIGDYQVIFGDGPLPLAIFELLEYIVNEVNTSF